MYKDRALQHYIKLFHDNKIKYIDGHIYKHYCTKDEWKKAGRITNKGYVQLTARINGKDCACMEHRLIYAIHNNLFELDKSLQINHRNGIKTDNHITNLEFVTQKENMRHAYLNGLNSTECGENNPSAKLKNNDVVVIRSMFDTHSNSEIALLFGVTPQNIHLIRKGIKWQTLGFSKDNSINR